MQLFQGDEVIKYGLLAHHSGYSIILAVLGVLNSLDNRGPILAEVNENRAEPKMNQGLQGADANRVLVELSQNFGNAISIQRRPDVHLHSHPFEGHKVLNKPHLEGRVIVVMANELLGKQVRG